MELGSASDLFVSTFSCNHGVFYMHWLHEAWNTGLLQTVLFPCSKAFLCVVFHVTKTGFGDADYITSGAWDCYRPCSTFRITMACSTCIDYMEHGTLDCFKPCYEKAEHGLGHFCV